MEKTLNFESLLVRLGDDIELVNEILHLFIDTIPEQVEALKSAVEERNTELIQYAAHTLKGSAGNISAEKLADAASILEIAGKEGNIKDAESLLSVFMEEYKELEIVIRDSFDTSSTFQ